MCRGFESPCVRGSKVDESTSEGVSSCVRASKEESMCEGSKGDEYMSLRVSKVDESICEGV